MKSSIVRNKQGLLLIIMNRNFKFCTYNNKITAYAFLCLLLCLLLFHRILAKHVAKSYQTVKNYGIMRKLLKINLTIHIILLSEKRVFQTILKSNTVPI